MGLSKLFSSILFVPSYSLLSAPKAKYYLLFGFDLLSLILSQLFISDLNNIDNPFRLGSSIGRTVDFECLDWNKVVPHIMVTGSNTGFVTVWDVKTKKESLTLNNLGRKAVGAIVWDPDKVSSKNAWDLKKPIS